MSKTFKYRLSVTAWSGTLLLLLFALSHWTPPKKSIHTKQYAQPIVSE